MKNYNSVYLIKKKFCLSNKKNNFWCILNNLSTLHIVSVILCLSLMILLYLYFEDVNIKMDYKRNQTKISDS